MELSVLGLSEYAVVKEISILLLHAHQWLLDRLKYVYVDCLLKMHAMIELMVLTIALCFYNVHFHCAI